MWFKLCDKQLGLTRFIFKEVSKRIMQSHYKNKKLNLYAASNFETIAPFLSLNSKLINYIT